MKFKVIYDQFWMILKHSILFEKSTHENLNEKFTFEQDEVNSSQPLEELLRVTFKVIWNRFRMILGHFMIFEKSTHEDSNEKFGVEQNEVNSSQELE